MSSKKSYTTDFVTSKDGTKIGYRQLGSGAGLLLVHGGMMSSQNFMKLGELLSSKFTAALDALIFALPKLKRIELKGVGHLAADNGGNPKIVANELRIFFGSNN